MGHTRMTTQGNENRNYNNHPFLGQTREGAFALTHNGVIQNDRSLRKKLRIPKTGSRRTAMWRSSSWSGRER